MISRSRFFLLVLVLLPITLSAGDNKDTILLSKSTHIYSIKGNDTLWLDKYEPTANLKEKSPVMFFVFGGGFFTGTRDKDYYLTYFKFLTENGYTVFSIDYRLGFQRVPDTQGKKVTPKQFLDHFNWTIHIAMEDLFDATLFVLEQADEWNLDKNKMLASGSSAGAVTVLHGEYEISTKGKYAERLPEDFNYAGIISFAGAIYNTNGKLKWSENTAPIQLFHGSADKNVPYDKIRLGKKGFFGSKNIAKRLEKQNLPFYFYTEEYADHRLAITPTYMNQQDILTFLEKYVDGKSQTNTVVTVKPLDQKKVKKHFTIIDYVNANLRPQR